MIGSRVIKMTAPTLKFPPRVPLARLPTPLDPSARLGSALGLELLYKRDDLTGLELSGNKARKLELLVADAEARGAPPHQNTRGGPTTHSPPTAGAGARPGGAAG